MRFIEYNPRHREYQGFQADFTEKNLFSDGFFRSALIFGFQGTKKAPETAPGQKETVILRL